MLFLLLLTSCRNESVFSNATNQEKQQDEFFSRLDKSLSNNPDKDKIIERIRRENEKSNFLSKINKHHGEAKFEKQILKQTVRSSKTGKASDSIVYLNIPFGNDKYLTSVLFIEYSPTEFTAREIDNIKLRQLAYNENIDKQQRENLIMNYILLDKMQYNSDLYVNIPATLFESIKKSDSALTKSFRIVNYKISSKSSPTARDGDITICLEIEDENCSCHGTHWECYEIGGGGTGNGDDGGTGGGTGTGGTGGDNSGGGGGDGTGTGNGNPENTDPCSDPNSPWYTHHSCGNSNQNTLNFFTQKMNSFGYDISSNLQFLGQNPVIRISLANYLNNNNNQATANFINWAISFFVENSDSNGISLINWEEMNLFISTQQNYRDEMSISEKQIFDNLNYGQQMNYLMSAFQALNASQNIYGTQNCSLLNGKGDAFRHTYWNALCRRRLGLAITNQLTTAHEDKPFTYSNQYKEKEMDLYNNSIGMNLVYNQWATIYTIQDDIKTKLNNGDLKYINNLDSNCKATNNSILIQTNQ